MLIECEQLVELVSFYISHYKACTSSRREPTVIEKLEKTISLECSEEAFREKVNTSLIQLNFTSKVIRYCDSLLHVIKQSFMKTREQILFRQQNSVLHIFKIPVY